jgi:AmmeMemoRadiSam system protein B
MSSTRRPPAVAGYFYPGDPAELERSVRECLASPAPLPASARGRRPKAVIVPHAGYMYSGPIAGSAYAAVRPYARGLERVILLGPAHRVALRGLAASSATSFATPLGEVRVDEDSLRAVLGLPQLCTDDEAHRLEHSLEVQLPFLQVVLPSFRLVPLAVGDASIAEVAQVLDMLWGGDETLLVISSDLSHYYDYATARRLDRASADAIEELRPQGLGRESACGRIAVRGLLDSAARHGLSAYAVDLRNSGDTAAGGDEVVGYGAFVFV